MKIRTLAILSVVALFLCGCSTPMNEIPMYGEGLKSPEVQKWNQEFVDWAVKESGGDGEKASDGYVQLGWKYYDRNDLSTAMKRFNQAWLLNTNNAGAYQGMGVVVGQRANTESDIQQSIKLLETARAKAPADGRIMIDLAISRTTLGAYFNYEKKPGAEDEFSKAEALFAEAMKTESENSNLYFNHSRLEFWKKNYPKAKAKLDEAVRLGYKPTPEYLKGMELLKEWSEKNKGK
jgi:tetratricopeptide (TPR) repeat protein